MYIMNNCDIETEIEFLSSKRYYNRYIKGYPGSLHEAEKDTVEIYIEFESIYSEYGCDFILELKELVLLSFLDKNRKKDHSKEFEKKYIKENGEELDD